MSKKESESFEPLEKELNDFIETNREKGISLRQACFDVFDYYMQSEVTKDYFYNRINKIVNGSKEVLRDEEKKAFIRYSHVLNNIHSYGNALHSLTNLDKKLQVLQGYINTGYGNKQTSDKIFKELKQLTKLTQCL